MLEEAVNDKGQRYWRFDVPHQVRAVPHWSVSSQSEEHPFYGAVAGVLANGGGWV